MNKEALFHYHDFKHYLDYLTFFQEKALMLTHTLLTYILLVALTAAVTVKTTSFVDMPKRMFYLKNTPTILLLESTLNNVFVSNNEGASWTQASSIPNGAIKSLFMHPFDQNCAYAFSDSTDHYLTTDKGASWLKFTTPLPPALYSPLLSFNSARPSLLLFAGRKCDCILF